MVARRGGAGALPADAQSDALWGYGAPAGVETTQRARMVHRCSGPYGRVSVAGALQPLELQARNSKSTPPATVTALLTAPSTMKLVAFAPTIAGVSASRCGTWSTWLVALTA